MTQWSLEHQARREEVEMRVLSVTQDLAAAEQQAERAKHRSAKREELARELLAKLIETDPRAVKHNVRAAVEYTDALLAELEKGGA